MVTVVEALERDVQALGKLPAGSESLVASAFALAVELDVKNSATSKSMCARALNETMAQLRAMAPPAQVADRLDDLTERRAKRQTKTKAKAKAS